MKKQVPLHPLDAFEDSLTKETFSYFIKMAASVFFFLCLPAYLLTLLVTRYYALKAKSPLYQSPRMQHFLHQDQLMSDAFIFYTMLFVLFLILFGWFVYFLLKNKKKLFAQPPFISHPFYFKNFASLFVLILPVILLLSLVPQLISVLDLPSEHNVDARVWLFTLFSLLMVLYLSYVIPFYLKKTTFGGLIRASAFFQNLSTYIICVLTLTVCVLVCSVALAALAFGWRHFLPRLPAFIFYISTHPNLVTFVFLVLAALNLAFLFKGRMLAFVWPVFTAAALFIALNLFKEGWQAFSLVYIGICLYYLFFAIIGILFYFWAHLFVQSACIYALNKSYRMLQPKNRWQEANFLQEKIDENVTLCPTENFFHDEKNL